MSRQPKKKPGEHPNRRWKKAHREAGYHEQDWNWQELGPDHPVCGHYICKDGSILTVRYLEKGHTGAPELELSWLPGPKVTVLDASVAEKYLVESGARPASQ